MKRHRGLHDLSADHYHGLVHAQHLQRAATGQFASMHPVAQEFLTFWAAHTNFHFREEEEVLLPMVAHYMDIDIPPINQMLREHVLIRCYVLDLQEELQEANTAGVVGPRPETLQTLGTLLEGHIRLEERVIFPQIEAAVPSDILGTLPNRFRAFEHAEGHTRTPESLARWQTPSDAG